VDFMLFTGDPVRMTGDSCFVFPMVGFGLRMRLGRPENHRVKGLPYSK